MTINHDDAVSIDGKGNFAFLSSLLKDTTMFNASLKSFQRRKNTFKLHISQRFDSLAFYLRPLINGNLKFHREWYRS